MFAINWPFVVRILTHVGRSASPPSGSYAADGTNAISIATETVMSTSSASRTDGTVAWYVYLCERECGHRHEERKIPIRLRMSEQQKDGGDACVRAMERLSAGQCLSG